ncbi:hypothetical protein IWX49DRAFT_399629 [Phyllosticta citricarpa]
MILIRRHQMRWDDSGDSVDLIIARALLHTLAICVFVRWLTRWSDCRRNNGGLTACLSVYCLVAAVAYVRVCRLALVRTYVGMCMPDRFKD